MMGISVEWDTVVSVLHCVKQTFIYINFSIAMVIFVPYISLILLDLVVYFGRVCFKTLTHDMAGASPKKNA